MTESSDSHLVSPHCMSNYRFRPDRLEIPILKRNFQHFQVLVFVSRASEINTYLNNTLYIFPYLSMEHFDFQHYYYYTFSSLHRQRHMLVINVFLIFKGNINQFLALLCLKFFIDFPFYWVKKWISFYGSCTIHCPSPLLSIQTGLFPVLQILSLLRVHGAW